MVPSRLSDELSELPSPTLNHVAEGDCMRSFDSMEGVPQKKKNPPTSPEPQKTRKIDLVKALVLASSVMMLAWWVHQLPFAPFTLEGGHLKHPIGVSAMAILLGIAIANIFPQLDFRKGCRWITTWSIPVAIVFLGMRMDLALLSQIGWGLLLAIITIMAFAIATTYGFGRLFGMNRRAASLLGIGTAVCGSSAILAAAPVAGAEEEDVVVTVSVVNLVGLIAMFSCVGLLWFIPLSAEIYGAWAGSTIHAVPQVVAAGESHSLAAAAMATLVKLTRVTMLAPVVLITALVTARHAHQSGTSATTAKRRKLWQYVPWFIWGFIALATLRATGWVPTLHFHANTPETFTVDLRDFLPAVAKWLLALSMAAIGLQVHLKPMLKAGSKAFLAGILGWLCMSGLAFALCYFLLG